MRSLLGVIPFSAAYVAVGIVTAELAAAAGSIHISEREARKVIPMGQS